jgi:hypothetical protein
MPRHLGNLRYDLQSMDLPWLHVDTPEFMSYQEYSIKLGVARQHD